MMNEILSLENIYSSQNRLMISSRMVSMFLTENAETLNVNGIQLILHGKRHVA